MKFDFLNNERINQRFETCLRNIRSESNSFYDSYLDLIETTIRFIIKEENIDVNKYSLGEIILDNKINNELFRKLNYNSNTLVDYVRKCNKHKHDKEKEISLELVLTYMNEFFKLINSYLELKDKEKILFNINYFTQIYGQTKRDNINLNKKVKSLLDELEDSYSKNKLSEENMLAMQKLLETKDVNLGSLEENNELLRRKIDELKDIKISSMENKLNKTIELLLDLKEDINLNKALSKAVGHSIMGDNFDTFIKEEVKKNNGK